DRDLVRRLGAGQLSATAIWQALKKRASLRHDAAADLTKIAGRGDRSAAVAAAILGDVKLMSAILDGKSGDAPGVLLSCAVLTGDKLSFDRVSALLASREGHVPDAAEAYLRADDGPQARRALLATQSGQARILGNRSAHDPGHVSYGQFDEIEEDL